MIAKIKPRQHRSSEGERLPMIVVACRNRNMAVYALLIQLQLQVQVYKIKAKHQPV